ncbi:hypothetical protein A1U7_02880 [Escherichia coli KTE67]|nr:hypothetical protein A1U7_02880 [Escherichia coli KTE67]EQO43654.1 hypothetical protein G714_01991 [Escherichia coli HVH 39 (4-2679949)]EQW18909.1 hypothetical protein G898_02112 [Escherichia coli UMEA 3014-1]EQX18827.1 hypothetical protein G924_02206 [Escherichia coli UMEA 3161-1]STF00246.1 Uncharacterised protein [Escherichia coli]
MIQCVYSLRGMHCTGAYHFWWITSRHIQPAVKMEAPGCEERFCPWLLRIINGIHTRSEMTGC